MTMPPTIAHYRVVSKLGEGGMGAVFRATDTKLKRDVAIKLLPDSLAADPDRMARFSREAQILASLNHPNIASIYGVEERALVMELVEGSEPRGPLAESEALGAIQQLVDALEYAHERGVVHRDLKPANLKISSEGRLKVLDFGLAKAMSGDTASGNPMSSPTITMGVTMAGTIMGTAAYMAPEQARGLNVDKRADIWAFGAVIYELLTGKLLFQGVTVSDTLAAVLRQEIDLAGTPARYRRLLRACLQRDPRRRMRDIGDARLLLEDASTTVPNTAKLSRLPWMAAGIATAAALTLAALRFAVPDDPSRTPVRLTMPAPDNSGFLGFAPAVSPDGRKVAFIAATAGKSQIWVRGLADTAARPIPDTDAATYPFWSPESRFVGFFAGRKVKKVAVDGGPPAELCEASNPRGGAWSASGIILFAPGPTLGLRQISASNGTPTVASEVDAARQEFSHRLPQFLPDGRHYLVMVRSNDPQKVGVYAGELGSNARRLVLPVATEALYAQPGFLLFLREGTLMAQPFDASTLRLSGEPVQIAEGVDLSMTNGAALFSASETGVLAYYSGGVSNDTQLTWLDLGGKPAGIFGPRSGRLSVSISPDGRFVAESRQDPVNGAFRVWIDDLAHGTDLDLAPGEANTVFPVWSPDSSRVVYYLGHQDGTKGPILVRDASGAGSATTLLEFPDYVQLTDWSHDGRYILFTSGRIGAVDQHLWVIPMTGYTAGKPYPYLDANSSAEHGRFSPDGRWMAYVLSQNGTQEVYVQSFPEKHGPTRVSIGGGSNPEWSPDGRRLYFLHSGDLMATDVQPGLKFEHAAPRALFPIPVNFANGEQSGFSISPDGKRALAMAVGSAAASARLNIILNWQLLLKK